MFPNVADVKLYLRSNVSAPAGSLSKSQALQTEQRNKRPIEPQEQKRLLTTHLDRRLQRRLL